MRFLAHQSVIREKNLMALIPQWEKASQIRSFIDAVRLEVLRRLGIIDDSSEAVLRASLHALHRQSTQLILRDV